jgi:hypothetical protein
LNQMKTCSVIVFLMTLENRIFYINNLLGHLISSLTHTPQNFVA